MVDQARLKAAARASRFYEGLERLLKRLDPQNFGPTAASMIHELIDKPDQWSRYPLHYLVHSIEANCAYHRKYLHDPIAQDKINKIMNHYHDYYDPYLQYVLTNERNLNLALIAMARQQFRLQAKPSSIDFARSLLLFVEDNALPKTTPVFLQNYGFNLHDWVYMCFAILSFTYRKRPPITSADNYLDSELQSLPKGAVQPFLQLSSLTPDEVGDKYNETRLEYPPYLHIFIPSIFFQFPLIRYGNGDFISIHPQLLINHSTEGLYRACISLAPELFLQDFGLSFENYVGKVLSEMPNIQNIWRESDIQEVSPGRACDYLIDHKDCFLLVESKATRYSSTLLTENAIANDNSTGKIAEALDQIYQTTIRINSGELDGLLGGRKKPILGFCITYGNMDFVNSPWYFQNFIKHRMHTDLTQLSAWPEPLSFMPQALSIDTLEDFIIVTRELEHSPPELVQSKLEEPYEAIGDWPSYLNKFRGDIDHWNLPLLENAANEFFDAII